MKRTKKYTGNVGQPQSNVGILSKIRSIGIVSKGETGDNTDRKIYKMVLSDENGQPVSIFTNHEWRHKWYCAGARAKQMAIEFVQFIAGITGKTFVATDNVNTSEMFELMDDEYLTQRYGVEKAQEYKRKFLCICSSNYFTQRR